MKTTAAIRTVALARAGWGALLLASPATVLGADARTAKIVVRVLGVRHLAQGLVTAAVPTPAVSGLGALVDALHAAGQTALAAGAPRWRRRTLADALLAATLGGTGWALYKTEES